MSLQQSITGPWRRSARLGLVLVVAIVAAGVAASAASAIEFQSLGGSATDLAGQPERQAGSHPDVTLRFTVPPQDASVEKSYPAELPHRLRVDMPLGLVGNPTAAATCSMTSMTAAINGKAAICPIASQIGMMQLINTDGSPGPEAPIYNIERPAGLPGLFAFTVLGVVVRLTPTVRAGTYGITIDSGVIAQGLLISGARVTLWGVPSDPVHDPERYAELLNTGFMLPPASSQAPRKPFLTLPTSCPGTASVTTAHLDGWDSVGQFATQSFSSDFDGVPFINEGCEKLPFAPSMTVRASARTAGAPTGLSVDLDVPQGDSPDGLATAHVKDVSVRLPAGMSISPSSASGLAACSDTQLAAQSEDPEQCPVASKLGTVSITSPLLADPLSGNVYLGSQLSSDPASGKMFRLFLVAAGSGVRLKLVGGVRVDPVSGRITAVFDDNPQLPFSNLHLELDGGAGAPLTVPDACGTFTTHAVITSWSGKTVASDSAMRVDQGCDRAAKFEPSLSAGTLNPVAGGFSSFVMRFSRPDGQQELGSINGSLPPGLLGVLASVPLCSATQGAAGTCPAASRIGKVQVAAGAGAQPVWLPVAGQGENPVYLTEPYRKGDVAGMSIVTRAVAGPYDLGTVVTKVYLELRQQDQGIDLQSDRLPRILGGVPLNIRDVVVTVDRQGFMVNPTSCSVMSTYANVFSQSWAKVPITSRFQVGGCASSAFSPIITASAGGRGNVKRYQHPSLRVTVRQPAGQAHLSKANVVLPKELNIDLKAPALKASCPRDVYAQDQCSPVATVGTVKAITPLLREPLTGPAFLIQKKGQLPDLVMRLRNNRMSLDLIGVLDFLEDGRLITRVKNIPDAALSSFVLSIKGGKDGSLLNRHDLCAHKRLTKATFKGQNGKLSRKSPVTRITGCPSKASTSRAASRRAARAARAKTSAARDAHAGAVRSRAVGGGS